MIDEKLLIDELNKRVRTPRSTMEILKDIIPLVESQPKVATDTNVGDKWIPFECREADEEEKEVYGCKEVLCCKMPDEDEEILVSYAYGYVDQDILLCDETGYYLESGSDFMTEAVAWMPLPQPYREKVE